MLSIKIVEYITQQVTNSHPEFDPIFIAAVVWAIFTVFSKPVLKEVRPLIFTAWATLYGWFFLLILALFVDIEYFNLSAMQSIDFNIYLSLIYLGILAGAFGNIVFNTTIKKIGSTNTAIFVNLVPVFGLLFSAILLSENFSLWYIVSFIMIVIGVYLVNKNRN